MEEDLLRGSPNSRVLHDLFEKHFSLGDLGVFNAVVMHSLRTENPISALVVAPSGQFKSSVGVATKALFGKMMYRMEERFSEYGIIQHWNPTSMDNRTWYINDFVMTFDGLSREKTSRLLTFLSVMLSEGEAGIRNYTAPGKTIKAHVNLLGNIALSRFEDMKQNMKSSTFYERVFIYNYVLDRNLVRERTERMLRFPKVRLRPSPCLTPKPFPVSLRSQVYALSDKLGTIGYSSGNVRYDNLVKGWLQGHALLNGRKVPEECDVKVFDWMTRRLCREL